MNLARTQIQSRSSRFWSDHTWKMVEKPTWLVQHKNCRTSTRKLYQSWPQRGHWASIGHRLSTTRIPWSKYSAKIRQLTGRISSQRSTRSSCMESSMYLTRRSMATRSSCIRRISWLRIELWRSRSGRLWTHLRALRAAHPMGQRSRECSMPTIRSGSWK